MATQTFYPAATIQAQFNSNTGLTNDQAMADADDGTYIVALAGVGAVDQYTVQKPGYNIWTISQVDVVVRGVMLSAGTADIRVNYTLNGTNVTTATQGLGTSMTDYTFSAIARPGGGSWVPADFVSLAIGPEVIAGGDDDVNLARFGVKLTFTERTSHNPDPDTWVRDPSIEPMDPVLATALAALTQADFDFLGAAATNVLNLGAVTIPGTTQRVFVTLSQNAVVNPPSY